MRRAIAIEGCTEFGSIESKINEAVVYNNGVEEIAAFIGLVKSFLALDPNKRLSASEALRDPVFQQL